MEWDMLGKRAKLYGVAYGSDQDSVKLGKRVWTFVCDPSDGYRSYCEEVKLETDTSIGPFFPDPVATVTVREWASVKDREYPGDSAPDGFELVDKDGHVWLTVGTDNSDDYYPSYTFGYTPKEATVVHARPAETVEPIEVVACPDCGAAWDQEQCRACGWEAKAVVMADEDGEPRICGECGSVGTPGALPIDPDDEDGALVWYCQECQNDWQSVAAFEASNIVLARPSEVAELVEVKAVSFDPPTDPNDTPPPWGPGEEPPNTPGSSAIDPVYAAGVYVEPTRDELPAWTVGQTVLRYRNHHDKTPRTETIARVLKRYVVLETGERFGTDGAQWGGAKLWFHTRIEPLPVTRPVAAPSATEDNAPCPSDTPDATPACDRPAVAPDALRLNEHTWTTVDGSLCRTGTQPAPIVPTKVLCAVFAFTRVPEHDVPIGEAWRCGVGDVFWTGIGHRPISCPKCEGHSTGFNASLHCPDLAACDADSTCPACVDGDALGESYFAKLHDDPIAFLAQFDTRDKRDQDAIIVSIAMWGRERTDYITSFIDRSRARANTLGMLA